MNSTTDKAARLYNRLTQRYLVPDGKIEQLTVISNEQTITVDAILANGTRSTQELDPTRGVLDLSRQAQAHINQRIAA